MSTDTNQVIYSKTAKAIDELAGRRHGLRPRPRQLLILLDGKRPIQEIADMFGAQDLPQLINELSRDGFIAATKQKSSTTSPPAVAQAQQAASMIEPARLVRAKAYLIEISRQHLGLMAANLNREIHAADTDSSVRAALAHWNMALRESRSGAEIASPSLQQAQHILGLSA